MIAIDEAAFITSCISIASSLALIIWERIQYTQLHKHTSPTEKPIAQHLSSCIVMLAIADIMASVGFGISMINARPNVCFVQAQLVEIGALSSILWTMAISQYHLYQIKSCAQGRPVFLVAQGSSRLFLWICGFCWCIPLSIEVILINFNFYSTDEPDQAPWCWLNPTPYLWLIFLYGWLLAVFIGNVIIWMSCVFYMKQISSNAKKRPAMLVLIAYTTAFLIVWTFPIVHRMYEAFGPNNQKIIDVLRFGHAVTNPLQGFFNLIIYGCFFTYQKNYTSGLIISEQSMPFFK